MVIIYELMDDDSDHDGDYDSEESGQPKFDAAREEDE